MKVTGFFSYIGSDGVNYEVRYTADENGFRPEGKHIFPISNNLLENQRISPSQNTYNEPIIRPKSPEEDPKIFGPLSLTKQFSMIEHPIAHIPNTTKKPLMLKI